MKSQFSILPLLILSSVFHGCSSSKNNTQAIPKEAAQSILESLKPGDLVRAAANGDENKVRQLLKSGADVNESVLVSVASHGNIPAHQEAITPLLAAVAMNYENIASILINYQAKSTTSFQPTFEGYTARDFLLYRGQNATASLLRSNQ